VIKKEKEKSLLGEALVERVKRVKEGRSRRGATAADTETS